jgi:putative transcriptional regulator
MALGYAGWGAGQLDAEIKANAWLIVPADDALLFGPDNPKKWQRAIESWASTSASCRRRR